MRPLPILLTASVDPRGMAGADFTATAREKMYAQTLAFYLRELPKNQPIVFAENSGWNLAALRRAAEGDAEGEGEAGRVEWIAVNPALSDQSRGKGYNELILIDEAVRQSKSIRAAGAFMKVTGRYPIYNLGFFVRRAAHWLFVRGYSFYGDMKDHRLYDWLKTGWCGHAGSAALFATTVENYRTNISPRKEWLNDAEGRLLEHLLFDYMKPYRGTRGTVVCRFGRESVMGGLQGSNIAAASFSKDNRSPLARFKVVVGNLIRWGMPWFWF